jgi:hypothetical protein
MRKINVPDINQFRLDGTFLWPEVEDRGATGEQRCRNLNSKQFFSKDVQSERQQHQFMFEE